MRLQQERTEAFRGLHGKTVNVRFSQCLARTAGEAAAYQLLHGGKVWVGKHCTELIVCERSDGTVCSYSV